MLYSHITCCQFVSESDVDDGGFLMCRYLKSLVGSPLLFSRLMLLKDFSFVCDLLPSFTEAINFWQLLSFVTCSYLYLNSWFSHLGVVKIYYAGLAFFSFSILIYSQRKKVHVGFLFIHCMCYNFSPVLRNLCGLWNNWILRPFIRIYFRK